MKAQRNLFACLLVGLSCVAFGAQAGDKIRDPSTKQDAAKSKAADADLSEVKVRLRLIAIETAANLKSYERSFAAIKEQEQSIAYAATATNEQKRLPEYQQRLQFYQNELAKAKKSLVELETEKAKLTKQLGATKLDDGTDTLLERILERLNSIDKRLEKMGR